MHPMMQQSKVESSMDEPNKEGRNFLLTIERRSALRRWWREVWALIQWGFFQRTLYGNRSAPFGVVGHEGFSVGARKNNDEVVLAFYYPLKGPQTGRPFTTDEAMEREMRDAILEIARRYGYPAFWRQRKSVLHD